MNFVGFLVVMFIVIYLAILVVVMLDAYFDTFDATHARMYGWDWGKDSSEWADDQLASAIKFRKIIIEAITWPKHILFAPKYIIVGMTAIFRSFSFIFGSETERKKRERRKIMERALK
jgi:hypothetical protein